MPPGGIVVVDGEGRVTQVNAAAERMFGFIRDELTGKPVEMLVPTGFGPQHLCHRDKYMGNPPRCPAGAGGVPSEAVYAALAGDESS
ncbi:MAG: PAS domain-containing protein [Tepidisphaeraceae bacterium]|jgi:PAS domain-containing protein